MASELRVRKRQHGPSPATRAMIKQSRVQLQQLLETEEGGRRVVSPKTEQIIQGLIRRLDDDIKNPDFRNETKLAREMTKEVSEMHDRIRTDKAYEPAFRKLEELMEVQFHLRYGPYLALYTSHRRRAAGGLRNNSDYVIGSPKSDPDESDSDPDELKPTPDELKSASDDLSLADELNLVDELKPAPHAIEKEAWQFFLRESWPAIYERLLDEDVLVTGKQFPSDPTASNVPLVRLLQMVAVLTKQNTLDVARAMGAYVNNRNAAELQHYIKEKDQLQIGAYFSNDLRALSTPPKNCADKVPVIKAAILFVAQVCFKEFDWDDERQHVISWKSDPDFLASQSSTAEKAYLEEFLSRAL
ncbi:hypothetical protein ACHAPE_008735 [Trichoderma viride]